MLAAAALEAWPPVSAATTSGRLTGVEPSMSEHAPAAAARAARASSMSLRARSDGRAQACA